MDSTRDIEYIPMAGYRRRRLKKYNLDDERELLTSAAAWEFVSEHLQGLVVSDVIVDALLRAHRSKHNWSASNCKRSLSNWERSREEAIAEARFVVHRNIELENSVEEYEQVIEGDGLPPKYVRRVDPAKVPIVSEADYKRHDYRFLSRALEILIESDDREIRSRGIRSAHVAARVCLGEPFPPHAFDVMDGSTLWYLVFGGDLLAERYRCGLGRGIAAIVEGPPPLRGDRKTPVTVAMVVWLIEKYQLSPTRQSIESWFSRSGVGKEDEAELFEALVKEFGTGFTWFDRKHRQVWNRLRSAAIDLVTGHIDVTLEDEGPGGTVEWLLPRPLSMHDRS